MNQVAVVLFWALLMLAGIQSFVGLVFIAALRRFRRELLPDEDCPRAAVVLCLRGPDPFLEKCVHAVLEQDYPRFELRVVVDHAEDPARGIVEQVVAHGSPGTVTVQELSERRSTCSLKCSSLVQAVAGCDEGVEIVALLDADTIPHPTWLRELATALGDEHIGAASGNRWYMPDEPTFGAMVRYAWNAAAVVQMYLNHYTWGGSLGMRMQVIREAGLLDRFSHAFCEDTMIFRFLREKGWKVAFVPSLMMINRETCGVSGFYRWMVRQLLTSRLYHPRWLIVAGHGFGTTLALVGSAVLLLLAIATQNTEAARMLSSGLAVYEALMFLMLLPLEYSVRRIGAARGEPTGWLSVPAFLKLLLAVPTTQVIYPIALAAAMCIRRVDWRGVSYQIEGPWNVQLIEYRPFEAEVEPVSARSL